MILRLYNCDNRVLDTDEIAVLEIESPKIFSKIMCDFLYREFPARECRGEGRRNTAVVGYLLYQRLF